MQALFEIYSHKATTMQGFCVHMVVFFLKIVDKTTLIMYP